MYVTSLKKQQLAIMTEGPKAFAIIGGKRAQSVLESLNLLLGTITLQAEGVHVGVMYNLASGGFNWRSQDNLTNITNLTPSVSGDLVATVSGGPGTLIARVMISDPAFSTAFLR